MNRCFEEEYIVMERRIHAMVSIMLQHYPQAARKVFSGGNGHEAGGVA